MPEQPSIHWQQVSEILFETDPMQTACRENDCFDEYDRVARAVVDEMEDGVSARAALERVLAEWFGADLLESRDIGPVIERLSARPGAGGEQ